MQADGWSLDDKRQPLLGEEKLGALPAVPLVAVEHAKNNLPDVLNRWAAYSTEERERPRTAQSFTVSKAEIAEQGFDLSMSRYRDVVYEEVNYDRPQQLLADLRALESGILNELDELEAMLK
jgi:type I restriction enzyme M protein